MAIIAPKQQTTIDAFFRGRFFLIQPKKYAHRVGMDALLLASCVPENFSGALADFGSGCGGAGMAAMARTKAASLTLVENCPIMLDYAQQTILYPPNHALTQKIKLVALDITADGRTRIAAGIVDNSYDFIIMNPPFNNAAIQASCYTAKAHAHVMQNNLFDKWLSTAAACLKNKGYIAIIAKPESLQELLKIMGKRYGSLEIIPIHGKYGDKALRILIIGKKGSNASISIRSGVNIRYEDPKTKTLQLTAAMSNLSNGLCSIYDI